MIGVVVGAFLAGWLLSSLRPIPPTFSALADKYVLRLALPSLILVTLSRVDVNIDIVLPVAIAWGLVMGSVAIILVCRLLFSLDDTIVGALLLVAVLGNTSFLGLEMVRSLLGDAYMPSAIAFDQLGTFLALSLWGSFVAGRFGAGESGWKPTVTRLFRFAPFLAVLASIPLRYFELPAIAITVLDDIGRTVAPVAMGAFGLRFTVRVSSRVAAPALLGLVLKMVLMPGVVWLIAVIAGTTGEIAWSASILQAAAPPMVTAGVVAVGAGMSEDLVSFMVGVGTLISFASIPLLSYAF